MKRLAWAVVSVLASLWAIYFAASAILGGWTSLMTVRSAEGGAPLNVLASGGLALIGGPALMGLALYLIWAGFACRRVGRSIGGVFMAMVGPFVVMGGVYAVSGLL